MRKPMKNYNFRPIFHNFNENFRKNVSNFWRKFGKMQKYSFIGGSGAEPPETRDFIKNSPKSNGNFVFFENFHKLAKKI